MVKDGTLHRESFVCPVGEDKWISANSIPNLFQSETFAQAESSTTSQQQPSPLISISLPTNNGVRIDCSACKQIDSMKPTKIYRMSPIVVKIGQILSASSICGILFSMLIGFLVILGSVSADTTNDAESAGAYFGFFFGLGFAMFFGPIFFILGLPGYLLIMKKKVYRCHSCGFIIERS